MNIEVLKTKLLETLDSIDKDKLSLPDIKLYADILKTVSEIQSKNYFECLASELCGGFKVKQATIGEMKGGDGNVV
ncbi:MAG: hypothetical protein NC253_05405 [Ruminococcus sp.]|nr:hypothetical protein [Ruminococcus sp.]MCM1381808.1 hypothetical protein [Muribaculaceae bacterium]MCM1478266.1 hypothetical protein [Muribaculaceae bacterium]